MIVFIAGFYLLTFLLCISLGCFPSFPPYFLPFYWEWLSQVEELRESLDRRIQLFGEPLQPLQHTQVLTGFLQFHRHYHHHRLFGKPLQFSTFNPFSTHKFLLVPIINFISFFNLISFMWNPFTVHIQVLTGSISSPSAESKIASTFLQTIVSGERRWTKGKETKVEDSRSLI